MDAIKTASMFGDRAKNQFSAEFGDRALEGKMLTRGGCESIYGNVVVSQLGIIEQFGPYKKKMLDSNINGLKAFAEYAYDRRTNQVSAMLTDGTVLTPEDIKRPGYYSKESILENAYFASSNMGLYAYTVGIITALLTAFYSWRLLFMTFHGTTRVSKDFYNQVHESPKVMTTSLAFLAIGSIFSGVFLSDYFPIIKHPFL